MTDSDTYPTSFDELTHWMQKRNYPQQSIDIVNAWRARGDGFVIYQNQALDSSTGGNFVVVSYGSPEAQIPHTEGDPPRTLPLVYPSAWAYQRVAFANPITSEATS